MARCDTGSTRSAMTLTRVCLCALVAWTNSGERGEHVAEDLKDRGSAAVLPRVKALAVAGKAGRRRRPLPNERQCGCRSLFG